MNTLVAEVMDYLETVAPLQLQEKYDNSGLLIGSPGQVVRGVMVSLDCTEEVMDEAIAKQCNMIVSHHPAIFYGVRSITGANMTERIIQKAIKNDLVIYAIHTNLDNTLANGVNERIARKLGLDIDAILRPLSDQNPFLGAGLVGYFPEVMTELQFLALVKERMQASVIRHTKLINRHIRKVAVCGGAGSFLIQDARKAGAQALVTADMKYHQFFDADGEILILDIGHYESEQYTIGLLRELLSSNFSTFAAHCTGLNTNPVQYFT